MSTRTTRRKTLDERCDDRDERQPAWFSDHPAHIRAEYALLARRIRALRYKKVSGPATIGYNNSLDVVLDIIRELKR